MPILSAAVISAGVRAGKTVRYYETVADMLASTDAWAAGENIMVGLFLYEAVSSGATTFDVTNAAGSKALVLADGAVEPEQFGVVGDGTNETAGMEAVAAWGRRNGGLHLRLTPGKTYGYTNNKFLCNMPNFLIIDGNGASMQGRYVSEGGSSGFNMDKECLVFGTGWDEVGPNILNGTWVDYYNGAPLAASAAEGDTSFTVETDFGTDFVVGERALIYGFYAQDGGFPTTCRFFEYVTVADVTGDIITIEAPLGSDYRIDWPERDHNGMLWGPARALSLSRSTYQETRRLVLNDVHFMADPVWDNERSGRVWIGNYERAELNNCRGDAGMYIMQGQHFTDNGSVFKGNVELDKFIETVTLNQVRYHNINHGTGVKRITTTGAILEEVSNIAAADSLTFNGGVLGGVAGGGSAIPSTWGGNIVRFNGAKLLTKSTNTAVLGYTQYTATFAEDSFNATTRFTRLTISLADFQTSGMYRGIRIGSILTDVSGNPVFRVRVMPWMVDETTLALEGIRLDGGVTSPLSLTLNGSSDVDMTGLLQSGPVTLTEPMQVGLWSAAGGEFRSSVVSGNMLAVNSGILPEPGTTVKPFTIGYPRKFNRIVFNASKAYTGSSGTATLKLDRVDHVGQTLINIATFDLKQTGQREIDITGATGAVGNDSLLALPSMALCKVVLRTGQAVDYSAASDRAVWSLAIAGHPVI